MSQENAGAAPGRPRASFILPGRVRIPRRDPDAGAAQYAVNSRRLGEPVPAEVTLPRVEPAISALATPAGVAPGLLCRYSAATPATCGEAMEVPLMVLVAVALVYHALVMPTPG